MSALLERRLNPDGAFRLSAKREHQHRQTLSAIVRRGARGPAMTTDSLRTNLVLVQGIALDLFMELEALRAEIAD